jgi:hypothetical protein
MTLKCRCDAFIQKAFDMEAISKNKGNFGKGIGRRSFGRKTCALDARPPYIVPDDSHVDAFADTDVCYDFKIVKKLTFLGR